MVRSFVLRLRTDILGDGGFVGEIEDVASAERFPIRDLQELGEVCRRISATGSATAVHPAGGETP